MTASYTPTTVAQGFGQETTMNTNFTDIKTSLDESLRRDALPANAMSINFDMGLNKIINLGEPINDNDAARKKDVDDVIAAGLPTQPGNPNEFLQTDGTTASWEVPAATEVSNTPAGNIAATTVQAAIDELDTEKAALAGATFTGAVTVPTFTSTGIDDNATGERLQLGDGNLVLGAAATAFTIQKASNDDELFLSGGDASSAGANIRLFGGTHATLADNFRFRTGTTNQLSYNGSSIWDFSTNAITTTGVITGDGSGLTNLTSASETVQGIIELATQAEVDAGTDTTRAVTPATLAAAAISVKAWVNFNGTGTVAINDSEQVTSITDLGVGTYTVNLTVTQPNANFAVSATRPLINSTGGAYADTYTTTSFAFHSVSGGAVEDSTPLSAIVIGT